MGNCCMSGRSSSMVWAGDDWGPMGRTGPDPDDAVKEGLLGGKVGGRAELRIKISKKQLEELLRRSEGGGGAWGKKGEERVLERLIERSVTVEVRRRSWRPKLPSIPELDCLFCTVLENCSLSCERD